MKISHDKYMHYSICITISILFGLFAWWFGIIVAVGVGILKELTDLKDQQNFFSWGDIASDVAGAVVGALPHLLAFL